MYVTQFPTLSMRKNMFIHDGFDIIIKCGVSEINSTRIN